MSSNSQSIRPTWATLARLAIAVVALATAAACGMAAWQYAAPLSAPAIFPFSETYYARAVAAVANGRQTEALAWAAEATRAAPARAENWVLTAYVYETVDRRVSARVIGAIRKSYEVAPLSVDAHDFRLFQVFDNWSQFPNDLHHLAIQEARAYTGLTLGLTSLGAMVPTVRDPDGRMALGIIVLRAKSQSYLAYRQRVAEGTQAAENTVQ